MRGFGAFSQCSFNVRQFRLSNNFKFFQSIKWKLMENSQRVIRYYWRKYKQRKVKRFAKRNTIIKQPVVEHIQPTRTNRMSYVRKKNAVPSKQGSGAKSKKPKNTETKEAANEKINMDLNFDSKKHPDGTIFNESNNSCTRNEESKGNRLICMHSHGLV